MQLHKIELYGCTFMEITFLLLLHSHHAINCIESLKGELIISSNLWLLGKTIVLRINTLIFTYRKHDLREVGVGGGD